MIAAEADDPFIVRVRWPPLKENVVPKRRPGTPNRATSWPTTSRWIAVGTMAIYSAIGCRIVTAAPFQQPADSSRDGSLAAQPARRFEIPAGTILDDHRKLRTADRYQGHPGGRRNRTVVVTRRLGSADSGAGAECAAEEYGRSLASYRTPGRIDRIECGCRLRRCDRDDFADFVVYGQILRAVCATRRRQ